MMLPAALVKKRSTGLAGTLVHQRESKKPHRLYWLILLALGMALGAGIMAFIFLILLKSKEDVSDSMSADMG